MNLPAPALSLPLFRIRRWHALGDIVMALAAVRGLRNKHPSARIEFCCEPRFHPLVRLCPDVDCLRHMEEQEQDFINLDGVYEEGERRGDFRHPVFQFCEKLRVDVPTGYCRFNVGMRSILWARERLPESINVVCGLRSPRKEANWLEERWVEVVKAFPQVSFIAVDAERRPYFSFDHSRCPEFWELPNLIDLTGQTDYEHLLAVIGECDAALTVDTGIFHLAGAMTRPTVVLICCLLPMARLLYNVTCLPVTAACARCLSPGPGRGHAAGEGCLGSVSAEMVIESLQTLLRYAKKNNPEGD